jgi:hypothetical protein
MWTGILLQSYPACLVSWVAGCLCLWPEPQREPPTGMTATGGRGVYQPPALGAATWGFLRGGSPPRWLWPFCPCCLAALVSGLTGLQSAPAPSPESDSCCQLLHLPSRCRCLLLLPAGPQPPAPGGPWAMGAPRAASLRSSSSEKNKQKTSFYVLTYASRRSTYAARRREAPNCTCTAHRTGTESAQAKQTHCGVKLRLV